MYRALALKCINNNLDATDEGVAQQIANSTELDVEYKNGNQLVFLDGQNVTDMLYTDKVSDFASKISVHKVIREKLVEIQIQIAARQSVVMDGRDIGSVVLPNADLKFYL
ncbi:MAG: (d)CMP kinase, partial [Clostridia bacterium]|nr:(d)CMP kinase [Clostridia bacterium]